MAIIWGGKSTCWPSADVYDCQPSSSERDLFVEDRSANIEREIGEVCEHVRQIGD